MAFCHWKRIRMSKKKDSFAWLNMHRTEKWTLQSCLELGVLAASMFCTNYLIGLLSRWSQLMPPDQANTIHNDEVKWILVHHFNWCKWFEIVIGHSHLTNFWNKQCARNLRVLWSIIRNQNALSSNISQNCRQWRKDIFGRPKLILKEWFESN